MTRISGFMLTNEADDLAAQIKIRHEIAIRAIQEVDFAHSNDRGGLPLFAVPDRAQLVRVDVFGRGDVVVALVAAGQEIVVDLVARPGPAASVPPQKNSGSSGCARMTRMRRRARPNAGDLSSLARRRWPCADSLPKP